MTDLRSENTDGREHPHVSVPTSAPFASAMAGDAGGDEETLTSGPRDAGPRDAGHRDAGQRDAGPGAATPHDAAATAGQRPTRAGLWARFVDALSRIPLRARIGLLVMAAVGLSVAMAATVNYVTVDRQVMAQLDQSLQQDLAQLPNHNTAYEAHYLDIAVLDVAPDGSVLGSSQSDDIGLSFTQNSPMAKLANEPPGTYMFQTVHTRSGTFRLLGTSVPFTTSGSIQVQTPATLIVAQSMAPADETLARLKLASLLVGLCGIAVAGIAGFGIGRAGLRPVDDLTLAAEHVARTGELRPIDVHGKDEISRLATSFNAMLGALARSREHQRRLVADAGHELRTPLTSMRTNLDLLAQSFAAGTGGLTNQDRDELIADVRAQMEELSVLVSDLVELSRDEPHAVVREHLDLSDVVRAAIERVRRRAIGVRFEQQLAPWYLEGEQASLERAVTNLLDNAAKWSPPDGTVTISLRDGLLQVADEGPGIAEEDLGQVFERFYRSPEARTMPGSGLGLSIVRQAAENHGGRVAAGRAPSGGALLSMWLPGMPYQRPEPTEHGSRQPQDAGKGRSHDPV